MREDVLLEKMVCVLCVYVQATLVEIVDHLSLITVVKIIMLVFVRRVAKIEGLVRGELDVRAR